MVNHRVLNFDTRGDGGCIIVAPTEFSGKKYTWIQNIVPSSELPSVFKNSRFSGPCGRFQL